MLLLLLLLLFCLLCSLVHIELAAVDLSWDIIVRFGTDPTYQLPKAFYDDFVQVRPTHSCVIWYSGAAQLCGTQNQQIHGCCALAEENGCSKQPELHMLNVLTSSFGSVVAAIVSLQVAADEASHFSLLNKRLEAVGSHYGALPAHDGCASHSWSCSIE
jgi:hypothetical protein